MNVERKGGKTERASCSGLSLYFLPDKLKSFNYLGWYPPGLSLYLKILLTTADFFSLLFPVKTFLYSAPVVSAHS